MTHLIIKKKNEVFVTIDSEQYVYHELSDHFTFEVPGAKFMPQYRNKYWDGKIRLYDMRKNEIYTGLVDRVISFCNRKGYTYEFEGSKFYGLPLEENEMISPEGVTDYVKSISKHKPRPYQIMGIHDALRHNRKLLLSPTASGKSLMIYAITRYHVEHNPIFQLLFIKYTFVLLLSMIEAKRANNTNFYRSNNLKLQIIRSLLSILESGFFVLSFKHLSLANAHSIGALAPIIIVALSVFILNERVSIKTWIAIFIGFIGVLIIIRPTSDVFSVNSFIPLLAAFFLGLYLDQIKQKKS